jgi:hypothetical protein
LNPKQGLEAKEWNKVDAKFLYSGLSKLAEDRPGGRGFAPMKI